ncbi:hypothetical protein LK10_07345 [Sinomonas humi]|uniref:Uncharacterized protein n=1 Tax=Sinomonas humi TaxID=1338436 RepID=A0A0B2AQ10_9MICC|nr:hypothetical protein LK10_07345 [Sinomonas humi]
MRYAGESQTVRAFLHLHGELTWVIHALCAAQGPGALKNHAADALECLIGDPSGSPAPLDHLLGLQIQNHITLFGPMTFVRAVASEFDAGFIVEEYEHLSKRAPIPEGTSSANSLDE